MDGHSMGGQVVACRCSSGNFNMRVNMVGTHWLWVTWKFSMAFRALTSSKRGIITTVPPRAWAAVQKEMGAEWYRGAGDR